MFDHPFLDDQKETFPRQNCDFNWSIFFLQIMNNICWCFLVYKTEYARRNGRFDNSRNLGAELYMLQVSHTRM